eukprot:GDKJ01002773.1.p1 GENE.GDKJ01002773.1~~GDKJ01002773.1.p1  ORF type:complete len:612 (+),score=166.72 GDKJ01002773.1:1927-3762(+)
MHDHHQGEEEKFKMDLRQEEVPITTEEVVLYSGNSKFTSFPSSSSAKRKKDLRNPSLFVSSSSLQAEESNNNLNNNGSDVIVSNMTSNVMNNKYQIQHQVRAFKGKVSTHGLQREYSENRSHNDDDDDDFSNPTTNQFNNSHNTSQLLVLPSTSVSRSPSPRANSVSRSQSPKLVSSKGRKRETSASSKKSSSSNIPAASNGIVNFSTSSETAMTAAAKTKKNASFSSSPSGGPQGKLLETTTPGAVRSSALKWNTQSNNVIIVEEDDQMTATSKRSNNSSVYSTARSLASTFAASITMRPLTRVYSVVWISLMAYVSASLIVGIISVGNYTQYYSEITGIIRSSFHLNAAALNFMFYARGPTPFLTTQPDAWLEEINLSLGVAYASFMGVIDDDQGRKGETFGRRYSDIEHLLFDPVCLSSSTRMLTTARDFKIFQKLSAIVGSSPLINCGEERAEMYRYAREEMMTNGLVRAIQYWVGTVPSIANTISKQPDWNTTKNLDASADDEWFPFDALQIDINSSLITLRELIKQHAFHQVESDVLTQSFLIGGGVLLVICLTIVIEITLNKGFFYFNQSKTLLRVLPVRLVDDYRVIQKIFNVKIEEDEDEIS